MISLKTCRLGMTGSHGTPGWDPSRRVVRRVPANRDLTLVWIQAYIYLLLCKRDNRDNDSLSLGTPGVPPFPTICFLHNHIVQS
jgi:hypothetical protein